MQKIFLAIAFILNVFFAKAQTFNGTGGSIPGSSTTQSCWNINVTGVGTINAINNGLASVCIKITHPNTDELEVVLKAPDGTVVPLTIQNGGSGNDYNTTCFSNSATTSIKFGNAPFNGTFIPEGYLGSVNNGQNANGTWSLCIQDRRTAGNQGVLNSWSLTFSNTPAALPPGFPACANTLPANSSCANATAVCDFNGLCGSTSGSSIQDWAGSGLGSCFGLQNNSFIKFIASAATSTFTVWVPTSSSGPTGGIQMLFFSGTCDAGPVISHGCYPHIFPYQSASNPVATIITATGLTPGNTYYLMFDGFNNDNCTFRIAANTGVTIVNVNPPAPSICEGQSVNLTASGSDGPYTWSPGSSLNTTSGPTVTASPSGTTTYTVNTTTSTGCVVNQDVTVTVNTKPVIVPPVIQDTLAVCQNGSVRAFKDSVTPASGAITGYQWYISSNPYPRPGTLLPFATSATYAPSSASIGTVHFYVKVTNANGCSDTSDIPHVLIVSPPIATPTASVTIQPTCTVPTGTILVTAPAGIKIKYNIDGGAYQASGTFTGIAPGVHNITAKDTVTGCVSSVRAVTVNAVPTEALPTASVTVQPNCTVTTGTITVTAPSGVNYEYSVGGTYQAGTVFTGLVNGTTYNLTVKNLTTGCISNQLPLTVNAIPGAPAAPTVNTIQPDCNTTTGTITVTSPIGINYEYSNGGVYQSTTSFTNLAAGNSYSITVRDINTGCVSTPTSVAINAIPVEPLPSATVTVQPTCTTPAGTITITSPIGVNYQYSVGGAYQPGVSFTGLSSANYNVTVKNLTTGCISNALPLTVNPLPAAPAIPVMNTPTQPDCITTTGLVTVTSPLGATYQYSSGGAYQAGTIFSGLTPASYNFTVKDIATGCISAPASVTINAVPTEPLPIAAVTTQPTCAVPTGTVTVSSPLGINYQYSTGGAYQAGTSFTGIAPGNHNITVKNLTTGCISNALPLTVNAVPTEPLPSATVTTQPTCTIPTGTITITSPIGANYEYSTGGAYQAGTTFTGIAPGNNNITVKNLTTGCISNALPLTVSAVPVQAIPSATVTAQPNCTIPTGTITISSPVGANYQYSIGGTYQVGTVFTGLTANTVYNVTVKNLTSGCISNVLPLTVDPVAGAPAAAVVNTTQPDCVTTTGSITITSPLAANYEYSSGGSYQASAVFSGLIPGNYNITVKNISTGCISAVTPVTINAIPTQGLPAASVTLQPNCTITTGTITVSSPLGVNFQYSVGGAYQAGNVFTGLINNSVYNVTVKNITTGCISNALPLTVNAIPAAPPAPSISTPTQPDCIITTSSFTITSPTGVNYQYSVGGAYQSSTSFAGLTPGNTYPVTVKDIVTGCISAATNASINNIQPVLAPFANSPVTYCQNAVASALTATGNNLLWYDSLNDVTGSPVAPIPSTTTAGNTFYYVTQTQNGCESPKRAVTVTINVTSTAVVGFKYIPDTVCLNGINPVPAYDLGFTNGGTFTVVPATGLSINTGSGSINLATSTAGTYAVTYTYNTTGCVNGNSASFNITLLPAVNTVTVFSYSSPVCKNVPNLLPQTAPGFTTGGIFSSSTGLSVNSSTGEINPGTSVPGQYQVAYRLSALGCRQATTNFSFVNIADTASPVTKFTYNSTDVCISTGINPTIVKAANFTTGGTFTAIPGGLNINATTGAINIGLSVPGVYKILYSIPALACQLAGRDSITLILRSYGNPVTTFSYFSPVCKGDDTATAVKDIAFTPGGVFSSTTGLSIDAATGIVDLRQSLPGNYTVRYDVPLGVCNPAGFGTTVIDILSQPASPTVKPAGICGPGNVSLTAQALGTVSWYTEPGLLNQVNVGNTYNTFVTSTTPYYVTNTIGTCESEPAIVNAVVSPIPVKPFLGGDTSICSNDRLVLNAGSYNGYLWQDGSVNSTYTVTSSGIYKVIVSTGVGCEDSASINVTVLNNCDDIVFPNAFAPEGTNKTFGALGNLFIASNYTLRIYNRYGEVVFATADPAQRWDGTYKGKPVNIGAYVYVASYLYKNRIMKVQKGSVLLIR